MNAEQLKELLASVLGECYLGEEKEQELATSIRAALTRAPAQQGGEVVAWASPHGGMVAVEDMPQELAGKYGMRPLVYGDAGETDLAAEVARLVAENDKLRENERRLIELTYKAAPVQPVGAVEIPEGFQPLETVEIWAVEFKKDPGRLGLAGGMICKLLEEYAQLRKMQAAAPTPPAAEPVGAVYCVPTGDISESGRETYTHHHNPVPMADNIVLHTHPPASIVDDLTETCTQLIEALVAARVPLPACALKLKRPIAVASGGAVIGPAGAPRNADERRVRAEPAVWANEHRMKVTIPGTVFISEKDMALSYFVIDGDGQGTLEDGKLCAIEWIEKRCAEERAFILAQGSNHG